MLRGASRVHEDRTCAGAFDEVLRTLLLVAEGAAHAAFHAGLVGLHHAALASAGEGDELQAGMCWTRRGHRQRTRPRVLERVHGRFE